MSEAYDSTVDTRRHIGRVGTLLDEVVNQLKHRADTHDLSKLEPPEKAIFDTYTPKLRDTTYGSDEYRQYLTEMQAALAHHYAHNSHHPEHYPGGVNDMSLLDLIEMLCDWLAATERHADGSLWDSLIHNAPRFHIDEQLAGILTNTAREMGWLVEPHPDA